MSVDINGYLSQLGMGDDFKARTKEVIAWHNTLCQEQFHDLFISEYVEQNGTRRFESLFIFSPSLVLEAANFLSEPTIWIKSLKYGTPFFEFHQSNYDFAKAKPESRLTCICRWEPEKFKLELKASGEHCERLRKIVRERLMFL